MREKRVSSVLIEKDQRLFGLVTDRDLRNRVVAAGMDTGRSIMDIATLAPLTMDVQNPAFEALLLMARHNIHHVPVLDGERIVGMITATDLTEQHSTSAVYLAGDVYKQSTVEGLQTAATRIKRLQQSLASAQASAYSTGHIITAITDAITCRLLQLGEAQFGPPPVDYVWVAAGSQARSEQTAKSDQDNCMVHRRPLRRSRTRRLLQGAGHLRLRRSGRLRLHLLPGRDDGHDRHLAPAQTQVGRVLRALDRPARSQVADADLRVLRLAGHLWQHRSARQACAPTCCGAPRATASSSPTWWATPCNTSRHWACSKASPRSAAARHKGKIDLKHTGVVPIVDLARVYALAGAHDAVNTHDRLLSAAPAAARSANKARATCAMHWSSWPTPASSTRPARSPRARHPTTS